MPLKVVVGGQYGSEGKGAVAAWLASHADPDRALLAIRTGGPNAGHTVIGNCPPDCLDLLGHNGGSGPGTRHPWRLRQVPVAAVTHPDAQLMLAPGSEVDVDVLLNELRDLDSAGYQASLRMAVDGTATIISKEDIAFESLLTERIGSTAKGIGSARAARAMRTAKLAFNSGSLLANHLVVPGLTHAVGTLIAQGATVIIEGTQGYALGQHAGDYPYVTSQDCTAVDILSQAQISPWLWPSDEVEVWVVFRAYPIRVAGNSGPLRRETTWADLRLPEEHTTVTRKVRRVGEWDTLLARRAMQANGHPSPALRVAFTMADHIIPALAGRTELDDLDEETHVGLHKLLAARQTDIGSLIDLLGTGPATMIDLRKARAGSSGEDVASDWDKEVTAND